jgi:hypothetical protein
MVCPFQLVQAINQISVSLFWNVDVWTQSSRETQAFDVLDKHPGNYYTFAYSSWKLSANQKDILQARFRYYLQQHQVLLVQIQKHQPDDKLKGR